MQFSQGFSTQPLQLAESGYAESVQYPDLNWKFRILAAEAHVRKSQIQQAMDLLQAEPPPNLSGEILWRRKLAQASAFCESRRSTPAEGMLAQAAELAGQQHDKIAELTYLRGICQLDSGQLGQAETYLRSVAEDKAVTNPFLKTYAMANLGWCAQVQLRYEEAIDWNTRALEAARSAAAPPLEEKALANLGSLYAALRNLPAAQENLDAAQKLAVQLKDLRDEQKLLIDLALVQRVEGQSGAEERSLNRALEIATGLHDNDIASRALLNLSVLKLDQRNLGLAEKYLRQANDLRLEGENLEKWRLNQARLLSVQGDYPKAIAGLLEQLHQIESSDKQHNHVSYLLIWNIQALLANAYDAENNLVEAEKWFQRSIETVEKAATNHGRFGTDIRDNVPVFDDYVAYLIAHKQNEKALQVAQLGRARTLMAEADGPRRAENTHAWTAAIQQYLHRNHIVLLSYFATGKDCYLWTLTGTQFRLSQLGIAGPDLNILIDSYKAAIERHAPLSESTSAKKLFQILIQPASDLIPKGTHVMVLADSKLYSLNFETLISPQGGDHYWIGDVDIQNVSAIDLLLRPAHRNSAAKGLLLIGAPVQADSHFIELPHAREEMESVRQHFSAKEVTSLSGKEATPGSYTGGSPRDYKYIHLATHGSANAIAPLKSAIILSAGSDGNFKLLAQDIISPKLRLNAQLVTISACEGAGTNVQSLEGLLGLEWAFMRAGAHQVVAALWDVDDSITPKLMDDFYAQLQQGKSASEALRHAKLEVMKGGGKYATPYYWAALQLYTGS